MKLSRTLYYFLNKIPSRRLFHFVYNYLNHSNAGMVLALHRVTSEEQNSLNHFIEIDIHKLEKIIGELVKLDVEFISLAKLEARLKNKIKTNRPFVHISFDDGYRDNFSLAFPVFKKYNLPFSIFISSGFIENERPFLWWYMMENLIEKELPVHFSKYGFEITSSDYRTGSRQDIFSRFRHFIISNLDNDRSYFEDFFHRLSGIDTHFLPAILTWDEISEMHESGLCEIGVHTVNHKRFSLLTDDEKKAEIIECRKEISEHTGIESAYFAYPYGSSDDIGHTENLDQLLTEAGIRLAFTCIADEINEDSNPLFLPRIMINNSATGYTLRSRLNGSYQRELKDRLSDPKNVYNNQNTYKWLT